MPRRIRIALFGDGNVGRQDENSKTYPLLPEFKVAYHYREGMKATQCDEIEWRALLASKPTHVFLHYGGNDITSSSDPKTIYQAIEAKIRELWFHGCVVWAAGILPMGKFQDKTLTIQCYDRECSGSVVECLTRDRRAAGSSLTGVTALWSLSKTHLS